MDSKNETIIIAQQLKMQFHSTKKGDLETIECYVMKLKSIADSLAANNNPLSDPDLVLQLLAGLPDSPQYLSLKNTISSQLPLPNFSDACSMLYEHEKTTPPPPNPPPPPEENNRNSSKTTFEMIHDIASTINAVASIAREFWNALEPLSGGRSSGPKPKPKPNPNPNPGNKKNGRSGGRGNNNNRGRGGGGGSSSRNSGRK